MLLCHILFYKFLAKLIPTAILAYFLSLLKNCAKVQKKMHIRKKNLFFLPSTLLFPTHLPLVSHLSPSEPHRNLIGTSPYLYRKTTLISSTFHQPFSYKKTHLFQSAFLYSYQADTYNPFSSSAFSSSNSDISSI